MSVLVYDCGSVENTVTAILDTESGAMIIRGNGDIDNYADESSPWYSEHSDILQVTVDKGITRIGSGTFYGCENLSFVEIANTVTSIGADVFQNCTSLTSIKIPKSITDIGNGTFTDSGLTEVKFYGNPPTVGTDIFDGVTADVYTPEGNEEWTETAKGTVAGNGSNLTWKEFDSKPNLIEYDELDYLWSKIKKYVDSNVSVTPVLTSGTKIATITVNGVDTDLYSSPFSGTVGSSTTPIYIDNGVPTACGTSLAVDITGTANTAINSTFATSAALAIKANKLGNDTVGGSATPIYLDSGVPVACGNNLNTNITGNVTGHFTNIIGGRNLLRNTGHTAGSNTTTDGTTITIGTENKDTYFNLYNAVALIANKIYTLSFDVNNLQADKYITFGIGGQNNNNFKITVNKNGRIYATGFFTSNINAGAKFILDDITRDLPSTSFTLTNFKLEEGEQATAYSNAWEDVIPNAATAATATTATNATNVLQQYGTGNYNRPILLSNLQNITTTSSQTTSSVFSNKFYANPSTGVLTSVSGFSSTGSYTTSLTTSTHLAGNKGTALINSTAAKGYTMLARMKSTNGVFTHGVYNADYQFYYTADSVISAGTNTVTKICLTINENGTVSAQNGFIGNLTGDVTGNCSGSSGSCTGNAATATTATNAVNVKRVNKVNDKISILGVPSGTSANANGATCALTASNATLQDYSAESTEQRYTILSLGNATAVGTSGNRTGAIHLYGTGTNCLNIDGGTITTNNGIVLNSSLTEKRTYTLPDATGTLALTSSDITGNAASATYATCIRLAKNTASSWYYPLYAVGSTESTDYQPRVNDGFRIQNNNNSTTSNGYCLLQLGTATAYGTSGNAHGAIYLYKRTDASHTTPKRVIIKPPMAAASSDADVTVYLPSTAGTLALTSSDITGNADTATTATNAVNVKRVENVGTWLAILGVPSDTANNANAATTTLTSGNATICDSSANSTAQRYTVLALGNTTAVGTKGNRAGALRLQGANSNYVQFQNGTTNTSDRTITLNSNLTANRTYTLPNSDGTIALQSSCDPEIKTDIQDVYVLDKLKKISVKRFHYSEKKIQEKQWKKDNPDKQLSEMPEFKDNEHEPWYIHAMAQEFNEAFDVSDGDKNEINLTNSIGVCLRAIQELAEKVDKVEHRLDELS